MYILLLALIYLAFISLGLPDSLLGAAWPSMRGVFDVPLSYMGMVSMLISGGTIFSSLMSERLTKRLGTKYVTVISVFLTAIALFGFSLSNKFWMLCLWAIPYGLGAGAIDSALNNYVALHYNSRHMSWLHCFWGVGTIASPYVMSYALTHSSWNNGYRTVSYIQFGIAFILLSTLFVWKVNQKEDDEKKQGKALGIRGSLRIKGVIFLLLGFFGYCAAESTTILWASSYLVGVRGVSNEIAASFGALFFIGITAGRFVAGFISERFGDRKMIRIGLAIVAVGVLCVFLPIKTDIAALAGLVIIGVGCAPVYPSIIHSTPANFGADNSQAIIGVQMASAYVGSTFMPPLFGLIANHISLRLFPLYLVVFFTLTAVMIEITYRKVDTNN